MSPFYDIGDVGITEKVPEKSFIFLEPSSLFVRCYLDLDFAISPPTRALPFAKTLYILLLYICAVK